METGQKIASPPLGATQIAAKKFAQVDQSGTTNPGSKYKWFNTDPNRIQLRPELRATAVSAPQTKGQYRGRASRVGHESVSDRTVFRIAEAQAPRSSRNGVAVSLEMPAKIIKTRIINQLKLRQQEITSPSVQQAASISP
jgi:hypothetical protein